jgi:hypothetical protein
MDYESLKTLIETLGVHPVLGPTGQGWGIEQNAEELAAFLVELPEIHKVLEIGTGPSAGLARFMKHHLGWDVTTVDVNNYGHSFPGINFLLITPGEYPAFDEGFDLVILDGDHSYKGISADYEAYGELAPIVMIHDIAGLRDCEGVAKFWQELAYTKKGNLRKYFNEIVAEGEFRSGIGWVAR